MDRTGLIKVPISIKKASTKVRNNRHVSVSARILQTWATTVSLRISQRLELKAHIWQSRKNQGTRQRYRGSITQSLLLTIKWNLGDKVKFRKGYLPQTFPTVIIRGISQKLYRGSHSSAKWLRSYRVVGLHNLAQTPVDYRSQMIGFSETNYPSRRVPKLILVSQSYKICPTWPLLPHSWFNLRGRISERTKQKWFNRHRTLIICANQRTTIISIIKSILLK